jgi:hypothetical protein
MMEASVSMSAAVLDAQIDVILQVRTAWQQLDASPPPNLEMQVGVAGEEIGTAYMPASMETPDRVPLSLSA